MSSLEKSINIRLEDRFAILFDLELARSFKKPPDYLYAFLKESVKTSKFKKLKSDQDKQDTEIRLYFKKEYMKRECFILYTEPYGISETNYTKLISSVFLSKNVSCLFNELTLEASFKFYKVNDLITFYLNRKESYNLNLLI